MQGKGQWRAHGGREAGRAGVDEVLDVGGTVQQLQRAHGGIVGIDARGNDRHVLAQDGPVRAAHTDRLASGHKGGVLQFESDRGCRLST